MADIRFYVFGAVAALIYLIGDWTDLPAWAPQVALCFAVGSICFALGKGRGRGREYRRFIDYLDCLRGDSPEALENELAEIDVRKPEDGWVNNYGISWQTIDGFWWRQP